MSEEDKISTEDESPKRGVRLGRLKRKNLKNEIEEEAPEPKRRRGIKKRRARKRPSESPLEGEKGEISQGRMWLSQNWKTMLALFLIFLFGLFLRSYFYYGPATENGFILSGNDPYYHKRVVDYVQESHRHLIYDPLLSYPDGALNPRPPMFDWSIAILGLLLAPLFGGDVTTSTWQVMEFSPAFWGALTAIPVYLIGKEMFSRKVGLISAFLLSTMPSHVERSPLGFSDHDAIVLFFVVLAFFFFIKALNHLKIRDKWVKNWYNPRDILPGLKEWFKYNQVPVAFSILAGISLASIALIWKGFLYPVVIIIVYFFIQLIIQKLRGRESIGVAICTIITLAIVALLPIPYYYGNHMPYVIEPASEILLAVIIISAVLVPTRDSPWLLVFSTLAIVIVCGFLVLMFVFPDVGNTYFSGQGYFAENKVFSTIAEAQAPDYSRAMFSYGIVTTFLALYAILLSIVRIVRDIKYHYLFMTIWGLTSLYMAISATRFIFNAGPIFAILSGWMIYEIIVKLDFKKMMKHYRSLKGGGRFYAFKKSVKVSHVVGVLFLVFMIFLPNLWLGWDAGVPFGEKKDVDVLVYDALPWFMKPKEYKYDERGNKTLYPDGVGTMYNRTNQNELKYFGAFGHGFPSDYWLDSMRWLSEQDAELPLDQRPGFISWWDYGFWAIQLGQHPTAADNFQGRVQYAGSMISAKNESQGVALLIVRIIEGDKGKYFREHKKDGIHDDVKAIMVKYFGDENATKIQDVLINTTKYKNEVLDNPDRYGYYSSDLVPNVTPTYAILQTWIPELLTDDQMTWLLHDLQKQTGYTLRYYAIDSRLFPYGAGNTGIYYAPLKLSDHRISDSNEPYDFLQTFIVASDGREYTGDEFSKAVEANPNLEFKSYKLKYYEPFLDSMLYKCYIGYTLADIGASESVDSSVVPNLPGVHVSQYPPLPAWMMKHFQLVYRTAYWNPYNQSTYQLYPDAWIAMSENEANDLVSEIENDGLDNNKNGEIDESGEGGVVTSGLRSGVVYIKYYEGAYLNGTITTAKGSPIPNIRVTVQDEYGIPHDTTFSDGNGSYHLILPEGNVSIHVSAGGFGEGDYVSYSILSQVEQTLIEKTNINVTDDMAMRREVDLDEDGIWDYNVVKDFEIEGGLFEGRVFWDNNSNDVFEAGLDFNISGVKVSMHNTKLDMKYSVDTAANGTFVFDDLAPGDYEVTFNIMGHNLTLGETLSYTEGKMDSRDRPVGPAGVFGNITSFSGDVFADEEIEILDMTNHTVIKAKTDSNGNYNISWLLPGNYTLNIDINGFETFSSYVNLTEGNKTKKNMILLPSTDVEGMVTNAHDGSSIANATIRFEGILSAKNQFKFVTANENGFYSVDLRNGTYEIYVKHDIGEETPYVYLGKIDADGGVITHDISLSRTTEVFGTIYRDFDENGTIERWEVRAYSEITFINSLSGEKTVTSNLTGYYRVFLPQGDYTIYATFNSNKDTLMEKLSILQTKRLEHNISLLPGKKLDGHVYYDVNKNGEVNNKEGLSFAKITFTDQNGIDLNIFTDSKGAYTVNLPTAWNYTVSIVYPGFAPFNLPLSNFTELDEVSDFSLIATNITINGYTKFEGIPVSDINITFTAIQATGAENRTIASNSSGSYSVGLAPGKYDIIVDFNTTEMGKPVWYIYEGALAIEVGDSSRSMDLNLTKKIKVNGTIFGTSENVTINFERYREDTTLIVSVNGSFEVFLEPDTYNVSVDYPMNSTTHLVYLFPHSLLESETLVLNLTIGIRINGTVFYDGLPEGNMQIWITSNGILGTPSDAASGKYERFLPPNRTYDLTVNMTKEDEKYQFTYFGSIDVNTTDISGFDINLTKFVRVKGTTYIDWDNDTSVDSDEPMDNISIEFVSDSGTFTTMSNETGAYEIYLLNNEFYNITLSSDFIIVDEKLNITPSSTNNTKNLNIKLMNLTVSGKTTFSQTHTNESYTIIWFIKENPTAQNVTTTSDVNGDFNVELHYGYYTVYARKITGTNAFVYLDRISVRPRENVSLDLSLEIGNRFFGKAYYYNSTYQNLSAEVKLKFLGNGTISTMSDSNGLYEIWLPDGSYEIFANKTAFEFNMSMNYTYKGKSKVTGDTASYLNLTKVKIFGVDLEWIEKTGVTIDQNESVTYNISIKNKGNQEDTFDLKKVGVVDWNLTFPSNITLGIGESDIFEVYVGAPVDAVVEHGDIKIEATSRTDTGKSDSVTIIVNITQHFFPANLTFADAPIVAKNNTLNYTINIRNEGNGEDEFNFTITGMPQYWEYKLSEKTKSLLANEKRNITIIFTVPYNASELNATVIFSAVSTKSKETTTLEIQISPANLRIDQDDLRVSGDQISEGELNTEPIPGFESLVLVVVLIAVAFYYRRRRDAK